MLNKVFGGVASVGLTALLGAGVAFAQNSGNTTLLMAIMSLGMIAFVVGAAGWWGTFRREPGRHSTTAWSQGRQSNSKAAGHDLIDQSTTIYNSPGPSADSSGDEARAVRELASRSYSIGGQQLRGDELFSMVGDCLTRSRDEFLFGADVVHRLALDVETRAVPSDQILQDWILAGVVEYTYIAPPQKTGPDPSIPPPHSEHQHTLSPLGTRILQSSSAGRAGQSGSTKRTIAHLTTLAAEGSDLARHKGACSPGYINLGRETPAEREDNERTTEYRELIEDWRIRVRSSLVNDAPEFVADWDERSSGRTLRDIIKELRGRL